VKSERKVKKRLVTRLVTILLACLLVLTPILIIPATVGSDQSVVIEALEDLREDVSNLPLGEEGFKNLRAAAGQREALSNKINATINQVKAGAYRGAINKLKNDLNGTISKWVAGEQASFLIEKVNNIIELIQDIFQPPTHDIAIINVVPNVTQAYIGDSVRIDVTVANEGTEFETFDIYVYADMDTVVIGDEITIAIITGVSLKAEASTTLSVTWDTRGVAEGTYTISAEVPLVPDDNTFIDGTVTLTEIVVLGPPVASFTWEPETPEVGEEVTFDASSSYDLDGTIASWNWDFDDGTTGTGEIVEHAYADVGTYNVTLIVTDNDGLTGTDTDDVTVSPAPPVAKITENATTVLTGEVIHFDASESYDPDGDIVEYFWDFDDGTNASGVTVDHSYADNGTYTVTLTVTDDDGLTDLDTATKIIENRPPVALFTQSLTTVETGETTTFYAGDSYDLDGTIVSYQWDFDDGTIVTETDLSITHVYEDDGSYTVTLTVTDDDGATNSTSITKTVLNRPPIASFTQNATTVDTEEAIHFDASNSFDLDGDIVEYFWDFGDETNETGVTVDHTYAEGGNYTVILTVTDDDGATSSDSREITVNAPPEILWALFAVVGLGIAAAAATVIYLWYRRRRRKKTATATKPPTKPAVTLYLPAKILAEPDKSS